jgi:hypothetical protein
MLEIAIEFIILVLIQYPGAFIRWVLFRKKSYKEYLNQDLYWNAFPLILIALIFLFIKYW